MRNDNEEQNFGGSLPGFLPVPRRMQGILESSCFDSNPTTPTTLSSGVFYVLDQTTRKSWATPSLRASRRHLGRHATLSAAPFSIAVAPNGGFLYVGTVNGIYLYTIASGGALSIGNNGAAISGDIPSAMVISGSWLIDAFTNASGAVQMDAIAIDPSTGAYTGSSGTLADQTFTIANAVVKTNGAVTR